ncbi:MAG: ABC transporter ATP-binding protein [Tissierellia bacterium]|nr:ABC transporter ATP-binding protein [Tissierellia bacterium]
MIMYSIQCHHLVKSYKDFQLGPLNLSIPKGMITGLVGENGAGKSTLIKALLGLIQQDSGQINILGRDCTNEIPEKVLDDLGIVFDEIHFPKDLKIKDLVKFLPSLYSNWDGTQFQRYLHDFSLPENRKIKELSKGMKIKLSLAIALSHQAKILILDEGTSGLDPGAREDILDILLDFIQDPEHTVFCSTHILSDLEKVADYIAFIHKGKLYFMEEKDTLKDNYRMYFCSEEEARKISKDAIVAKRKSQFGVQLLVHGNKMDRSLNLDRPSIEDIMLFFIRGEVL